MKSQDIVILLKLVSLQEQEKLGQFDGPEWLPSREDPYSVRGLEASLGISKSEVNASINRSYASGLAVKDRDFGRAKPNRRDLCNFIIHGLKFVFPVKPGGMIRGVPTAFAAPMLESLLMAGGEYLCMAVCAWQGYGAICRATFQVSPGSNSKRRAVI